MTNFEYKILFNTVVFFVNDMFYYTVNTKLLNRGNC